MNQGRRSPGRWQWLVIIGAILLTTLASVGCSFLGDDDNAEVVALSLPADIAPTNDGDTSETIVDVYWDATYSMQGYTTLATGNLYRTLPDELGDLGSSMGQINFYRFGEKITKLEGRDYRQFSNPWYYTETITAFHNVIDTADPAHVSVVITDLFESDADWSNVTQKLKEKYFAQHLAVGIIGIKNPFNGDIFDIGLNAAKANYNSGDDPTKYRPFYMFIMGPENKVEALMERWKERQTANNETQYLLLSENLSAQADDFSKMELLESDNIFESQTLPLNDKRIREFEVNSADSEATLTTKLTYQPKLGSLPLDVKALKFVANSWLLDGSEWAPGQDINGKLKMEMSSIEDEANNYKLKISFVPEQVLTVDKVNLVHIALVPDNKSYQIPDWVRAWNMANVDANPAAFDGSKTVNLMHLVESLKTSVLAAAKPSIVNINLAIKR